MQGEGTCDPGRIFAVVAGVDRTTVNLRVESIMGVPKVEVTAVHADEQNALD